MPEKKSQSLTCSACGAPLEYDGTSPTVRCTFCNNVNLVEGHESQPVIQVIVEDSRNGPPARTVPPVIIDTTIPRTVGKVVAGSSLVGCLVAGAVLLFVGGIIAFMFSRPGSPIVPLMVALEPVALLPREGDVLPDMLALFYNVNDESRVIGRVGVTDGKLAWKTEPLPGEGYARNLVADGQLVFTDSEMTLLAFQAGDGSSAWQVEMPDQLEYSEKSLVLAGENVLAVTVDRSLQAYHARTGQLAWSRLLKGYDRQIRLVNNLVMVMDYVVDDYTYSLVFLDPADGREVFTLTPSCAYSEYSSDHLAPDSGMFFDPGGSSVIVFYDSSPGCVQRIALPGGEVTWQTLAEDWFSFSPNGFQGLLTPEAVIFQHEQQLLSVDRSDGTLTTLLDDEDYEFIPLALSSDDLVVRVRRTRGTERFELWGLEAASGAKQWNLEMTDSYPIDPPNAITGLVDEGETAWTWRLTPAGLLLVQFQVVPSQVVLKTIDPASGESLGEVVAEVKKPSVDFFSTPVVIGWQDQVIYFLLDSNVYALDTLSGEILAIYQ